MKKFAREVVEKLDNYVYRLVDPRTGLTFYVGKGSGNRVFDHAAGALKFSDKCSEDSQSAKMKQIRDILDANLEVITIIHRHGMDKKTAEEVEGALIDAYPCLTNKQNGHGNSEYGCMSAQQIMDLYTAEEATIPAGKFIIIKIRQSTIDEQESLYEAVRKHWRVDKNRIVGRKVLACVGGIIRGVFVVDGWHPSETCEGRMYFTGHQECPEIESALKGKRLPQKYIKKGAASPVRYS